MTKIAIVNPQFEVSFWGLEHSLSLFGKRATLPIACLPLLGALTPDEFELELVDENVESLDFDRLAMNDIVGLTGMSVQRFRMREILEELKSRGVFTVVGGPWVTVEEEYFEDLADVVFIGEAEETWPEFLKELRTGTYKDRYEQADRTNMTQVPAPRLDLLKLQHYAFGSMQISRGCPFQCEFCDIIVTFGRRPRLKNSEQVIAELDGWRDNGVGMVFIVDDNLIGNKKEIKPILRDVIEWQQDNNYPTTFFTEASLDLAEDEELVRLMGDANIQSVFIGIETPNEESLRETKKYQNVREKGGTMMDRIHLIQDAGIDIWCGMILGFDHDDRSIFDVQREFLKEARITQAMVGMLHAIPKTPLYDRLLEDRRLDVADQSPFGTNVIPLQMTREELRDGFFQVNRELYDVDAYFDRLDALFVKGRFRYAGHRAIAKSQNKLRWYMRCIYNFIRFFVLYRRLMTTVKERRLKSEYKRRIWGMFRARRDPVLLFPYAIKCATHYHYQKMVKEMKAGKTAIVNSF